MNRREFFSVWAGAAAYGAARPGGGRALVVLQLAGGNDGLNTVVPYEDDHYVRARTTLRLGANQVRKIGGSLGFHPELGGFERLLGEGRLAVVQGVGYPKMNRDHNAGMRYWQTARPADPDEQTGWLGRYADRQADAGAGDVPALYVGRSPQPLTVRAREVVAPSLASAADWTLRADAPALFAGCEGARATARSVAAALARDAGPGAYPQSGLAQSLRSVAQLLRAETGVSVYLVEHGGVSPGGYDNHSNQAGHHAVLLRELSSAVAAFCADLARDGLLDRVLLMTYSEFGRNLTENGRHGTNHGAAAPVFLAGGKLKAGVHGAHPSLAEVEGDAPKPHTDFRAVYATVLEKWLGVAAEPILGGRFAPLDVLG
jgi:uncharacterized protein (DUF1501 family)